MKIFVAALLFSVQHSDKYSFLLIILISMAKVVHETLIKRLDINGIRIGHLNINGLDKKLTDLSILLSETKFDIFAVTETHLCNEVSDDKINFPGYLFKRNDRNKGDDHWGGCIIFFSEALTVLDFEISTPIESAWIDIRIKSINILIGCIYRPPDSKQFVSNFTSILDSICTKRKNIIILGDFNIDLSNDRNTTCDKALIRNYQNLLYCFSLKNVINQPTRITDCSSTLIDHIITSKNIYEKLIKTSGCYDPCISDHHLIYTIIDLIKPTRTPKIVMEAS